MVDDMRLAAMLKSSELSAISFPGLGFNCLGGDNVGSAGGMETLANTFAIYMSKAVKYGDIGRTSIAAENDKRLAAEEAKTSLLVPEFSAKAGEGC